MKKYQGNLLKMNKAELIEKLEDIEWEDFEVKEAKSEVPKNSWSTVSAFSNTAGGWLVFGVNKTGKSYKITGVSNPEKIEQDFTTALRNGTKFNKKIIVKSKKYNFSSNQPCQNTPYMIYYPPFIAPATNLNWRRVKARKII